VYHSGVRVKTDLEGHHGVHRVHRCNPQPHPTRCRRPSKDECRAGAEVSVPLRPPATEADEGTSHGASHGAACRYPLPVLGGFPLGPGQLDLPRPHREQRQHPFRQGKTGDLLLRPGVGRRRGPRRPARPGPRVCARPPPAGRWPPAIPADSAVPRVPGMRCYVPGSVHAPHPRRPSAQSSASVLEDLESPPATPKASAGPPPEPTGSDRKRTRSECAANEDFSDDADVRMQKAVTQAVKRAMKEATAPMANTLQRAVTSAVTRRPSGPAAADGATGPADVQAALARAEADVKRLTSQVTELETANALLTSAAAATRNLWKHVSDIPWPFTPSHAAGGWVSTYVRRTYVVHVPYAEREPCIRRTYGAYVVRTSCVRRMRRTCALPLAASLHPPRTNGRPAAGSPFHSDAVRRGDPQPAPQRTAAPV
jgi:hypothetical protein